MNINEFQIEVLSEGKLNKYLIRIKATSCLYIQINQLDDNKNIINNKRYKHKLLLLEKLNIKNFSDIMEPIKKNKNTIKIEEIGKYLLLKISIPSHSLEIVEKFELFNVEYYLVYGPEHKRINEEPYFTSINRDFFCIDDIKKILDNEKIIEKYNIINYRYYDENKKGFVKLNESQIIKMPKNKLILELHFNTKNDLVKSQFENYNNIIMNKVNIMNNRINLIQKNKEYDLIYLYASPIIGKDGAEKNSPINYRTEIKSIYKLFNESGKSFNCLFECANEKKFSNLLIQNKMKILHIASHGDLDENGKYYLILEDKAKIQNIKYEKLENILKTNCSKLKNIDLVFIATCHSQGLGELFHKYGAKNVICIQSQTPISNVAAIKFSEFFYKELIKGESIKNAFIKAKNKVKNDRQILIYNKNNCCSECHKHKDNCSRIPPKTCDCEFHEFNLHKKNCSFCQEQIKQRGEEIIKESTNNKDYVYICCCSHEIKHCEDEKFLFYSNADNSPFKEQKKGTLKINKNCIVSGFDDYKYFSIIGRGRQLEEIYNIITDNKNHFIIIYGNKEIGKGDFAESLCVYLFERELINRYEKIELNSEYKIDNMNNYIKKTKEKIVNIIKINNDSPELVNKIIETFNDNNLYNIIIISTEKEIKKDDFKAEIIDLRMNNNFAENLLINICDYLGYKNNLDSLKPDEILKSVKYNPKMIKIIADLIVRGVEIEKLKDLIEKYKENKRLEDIEIDELTKNKIYYLLSIMPSGLPDSFIKLFYKDYEKTIDMDDINNNNLIYKDPNDNWNYIKENKEDVYKDDKKKECISESIKNFAILLLTYIETNRNNICFPDNNIHYIFNSYNGFGIWKSFNLEIYEYCFNYINNKSDYIKILNNDFNLNKYMENIFSLILNNLAKIKEIIEEKSKLKEINYNDIIIEEKDIIKEYLEQILLMLPSLYFLDRRCKDIIEKCKYICDKLQLKKSKERLSIFLWSLEKDSEIEYKDFDEELKEEAKFLHALKQKNEAELLNMQNKYNNKITATNYEMLSTINYNYLKDIYINYELASIYSSEDEKNNINEAIKYLELAKERSNKAKNISGEVIFYFIEDRINIDLFILEQRNMIANNIKENNNPHFKYLDEVIEQKFNINKKLMNEAYDLKLKYNRSLKSDIVLLSSNPLTNFSSAFGRGIVAYQNNQYYILEQLNQRIKMDLYVDAKVLNKKNLDEALNKEGKILIIQSDDFSEKGEIILESDSGESEILTNKDLKEIMPTKIKYMVVILCFVNSKKLENIFSDKVQYLITFGQIDSYALKYDTFLKYNKYSIDFIIDFIEKSIENNIEDSFYKSKYLLSKELEDFIILKNNNELKTRINYTKSKIHNEIILERPLLKLPHNLPRCKDYSEEIFNIIKKIQSGDEKFINLYLENDFKINEKGFKDLNKKTKIALELIKFFYRHQTFKQILFINHPHKYGLTLNKVLEKAISSPEFEKETNSSESNELNSLIIVNNYDQKYDIVEEPINLVNGIQYLVMTKIELKDNGSNSKNSTSAVSSTKIVKKRKKDVNYIKIEYSGFQLCKKKLRDNLIPNKKPKKEKEKKEKEEKNELFGDFTSIFKYDIKSDNESEHENKSKDDSF